MSRRCVWKRPPYKFSTKIQNNSKVVSLAAERLTIHSKVVVEHLKKGKALPSIRQLFRKNSVHVDRKKRPKSLAVLYHQLRKPSECLNDAHKEEIKLNELGLGEFFVH